MDIPADEELCIATLSDRDSVVAIDKDLYNSTDCLPSTYPSLLEGPGVRAFLYKKAGKTVAFASTQLLDGGRTLLASAGRLAKEYRGTGMLGRFRRLALDQRVRSRSTCYLAVVVTDVMIARKGLLTTFAKVDERIHTSVDLTASDEIFKVRKEPEHVTGMRTMSASEVTVILSFDKADLQHLFPHGRIIIDWKPYRLMAENVALIKHNCADRIFLGTVAKFPTSSDKFSFSPPRILSAGGYCRCTKGISYVTDVFGKGSEEELRAHIKWHLLRSSEVGHANVSFSIFYTQGLDEIIADLGKAYPLRKSSFSFKKLVVLEQKLDCQGMDD